MKLITFLILTLGIFSFADASQVISCSLSESQDQILITLSSAQSGTFAYRTAPESPGPSTDSGSLPLKRITSNNKEIADFSVQSSVVQMNFQMPASLVLVNSNEFKAKIISTIQSMDLSQEQELLCKSQL